MKNGWQIKRIGEVCDLATGGTPSRTKPEYFGGHIKWLVSGDINKGEIFDCEGRITQAGMKNSNAKPLPINSVMIALNGQGKTRGTVALLRTQATCNQSLVSIMPKQPSELIPEFLYANLNGRYEEIRRMTSDDDKDRRGLNMGLVRSIEIPVPPMTEQRRIVQKLDEAFAGIAMAKENAEKNLQNARALFEASVHTMFCLRVWPTRRLGEICEFEGGSQPPKARFVYSPREGYVRFLQIRDFGSEKYITYIPVSNKNRLCLSQDILIGRYGASVGKILTGMSGAYNVALMKTIPDSAYLNRGFFYYYLTSKLFQEGLKKVAARSAQNGFSKEDIYGFPVPVPPHEEQQKVTEQLRLLESKTQHLARLFDQKLEALESLKKSILHEAFSGNL